MIKLQYECYGVMYNRSSKVVNRTSQSNGNGSSRHDQGSK